MLWASCAPGPGSVGLGLAWLPASLLGDQVGAVGLTERALNHFSHLLTYFDIYFYYFLKVLFIHETQRERETETEGEAGSMQGARCGTRSWVPRVRPWAEGKHPTVSHLGIPDLYF